MNTENHKAQVDAARERLQACLDDPMWADHAEISKSTLRLCLAALTSPAPAASEPALNSDSLWQLAQDECGAFECDVDCRRELGMHFDNRAGLPRFAALVIDRTDAERAERCPKCDDMEQYHEQGVQAMVQRLRSILDGQPCLLSEPPELAEVAKRLDSIDNDAQDAARYRWARSNGVLTVSGWRIVAPCVPREWDKYIDTMLKKEQI